ncbi:MAG TPA: phage portal protein [Phycisphaerae bacterium]|nr:phage portal protein [Phycisphaerae bacterium]
MSAIRKLIDRLVLGAVAKSKTYGPNDLWLRGLSGNAGISWDNENVVNAYANSAIAYACISRIAKDIAGVPLLFLSDPEEPESERPAKDPVRALFTAPNNVMGCRRLIEYTLMLHRLRGEVFWVFDDPARPREVYPWFDPRKWREKATAVALTGWEFQDGGTSFAHIPGEVLHVSDPNPANPWRGQSPLQAAARPLDIDVYGDRLNAGTIKGGGERGLTFSTEALLHPDEYDQLLSDINARRRGDGSPNKDWIMHGNLHIEDPKLTSADLDILALQGPAKGKVCYVYGLAPVLIGDDDSAQFKSAPEAKKIYWQQTLVPLVRSFESAWDRFFVDRRNMGTYVRFDLSKVPALQDDENEKAKTAFLYAKMGVPLVALNSRFGLGFDDADLALVDDFNLTPAMPMAPPAEPDDDEQPAKRYTPPHLKGLTREIIKARSKDSRFRIQRQRRLANLERSTRNKWGQVVGEYKAKADRMVEDATAGGVVTMGTSGAIMGKLDTLWRPMGADMAAAVDPAHTEAAAEGMASIQELVDGKSVEWSLRRKAVGMFTPDTLAVMKKRGKYIEFNIPDAMRFEINEAVHDAVAAAVNEGASVDSVAAAVKRFFTTVGNQAQTIAVTEVGTLYSTSRFDEMGAQGFASHEWLTSIDEATRDGINSEYNHQDADGEVRRLGEKFSSGLAYPLEDGGDPGNVINCRCETIPAVEE